MPPSFFSFFLSLCLFFSALRQKGGSAAGTEKTRKKVRDKGQGLPFLEKVRQRGEKTGRER